MTLRCQLRRLRLQAKTGYQGSTETLKIWGLPTVGTQSAGGLPPLHASKYYRRANELGAVPCHLSAGRGEGLRPWGISGGCQALQGATGHAAGR